MTAVGCVLLGAAAATAAWCVRQYRADQKAAAVRRARREAMLRDTTQIERTPIYEELVLDFLERDLAGGQS